MDDGPDEDWTISSQWDRRNQCENVKYNVSNITCNANLFVYVKIARFFVTDTHTHNRFTALLDFIQYYLGELVPGS